MKTSRFLATAVAVLGVLAGGSTARANATCNVLLNKLRVQAACGSCFVSAIHMTNYQWPTEPVWSQAWWGGFTSIILNLANGHLVGSSGRLHSDRYTDRSYQQQFDARQPEAISYDIDPLGLVTFDGIYGPADPVCFFDKFMVIPGATAVEVLSFNPGPVLY